jgi:signal transduction histidine kinase
VPATTSRTARNATVIVSIALVAVLLSFASLQYSGFTSNEVAKISDKEAQTNSNIESFQLAHALENKIGIVTANIQMLVNSPEVQNQRINDSENLFTEAQKTTKDFTNSYFWINRAGKLVWADPFTNPAIEKQYNGGDRSTREYFIQPRETLKPYYSTLTESADKVPRLFIAYPIVLHNGTFNGIIASAIDLKLMGNYLESQLSPQFQSTVGMLDRNGVILYTQNDTFIGKNAFGSEFQSLLPPSIKDQFNSLLRQSLSDAQGSGDISYLGNTTTIAYQPVSVDGSFFAVLYIATPHVFASDVSLLIDQQRNFNFIIIAVIGAVAVGVGFLIVTWNRGLARLVEKRTAELKAANESLLQSNAKLENANKQLEEANSQLAQANERLLVHDRMQKEFINIAAHELRTPTQAIIGYSELLEMQPEDKDEHIQAISRNAQRLERLTSDILDVTRIEGNLLNLQKEKVNLDYIVSSVIKDVKNRVSNGSIKFVYEPTNIVVDADKNRLTQVISNLVSNAVKFTPNGEIEISASKSEKQVVIAVKDTGSGIDPKIYPRLFTKFATKSQTGTGLGLFISKSIVEAHGGRIWAENNVNGKGATFFFTLPAA